METLKKRIEQIPTEQLANVDKLFFRQIKMDEDKARSKFDDLIQKTREECFAKFRCQGTFEIFDIQEITKESIVLKNGETFKSQMLAQVMEKAEQAIVLAVTIHGCEELEDNAKDMMTTLFYDAWGTAFVEAAATWLHQQFAAELAAQDLHMTYSWSPGQHNVDISLQVPVFRLIQPEQIGITLSGSMMMHPKKSATEIIGIGKDSGLATVRACDFCNLRETCQSAYAVAG